MKIRPTGFPVETLPPKSRDQATSAKEEDEVDVRVAFTQAARILSSQQPEDRIDMERIERIRTQIAAGTYEIDDTALARALVEKELKWRP